MEEESGSFLGARQSELFWQCWRPRGARAVLAIVHGLGEHCGRYQNVVDAVSGMPVAVWGFDLRGFGRSTGSRGHVDSFWDYLEDIDHFLHLVHQREGQDGNRPEASLPVFLLGHSYGGLIALHYAISRPGCLAGLILASPCLGLAMVVPRWKQNLAHFLSRLRPRFSMSSRLDPDLLSRDEEVVRAYIADPLVHDRVSARLFADMQWAMERAARKAVQLRCPCLMLLGERDGIVSTPVCQNVFVRLGSADKELALYPGLYHELFNEVGKEGPLGKLRGWVSARLDRGPS